ncbi:DUF3945 domain-containing protein [Dysgonomonas sp. BGC7]|uniref:DUF3945 domain-containing protein n=1 Tax=Dysgonomonas sp. BGC7 TaxID=1658008 RepID=UPI000681A693|nr:DUF3945 domain-containing protein [Dysgonomonas sp. BGC7]MBD8389131.1 DUF3945 domain-containing protein [Dysgonomonas sp. BGC7]
MLKDKYDLTYGKGKDRVKRDKLNDPDRVKYYMYDTIRAVLPECKVPADLRFGLKKFEIELDYKFKRGTNQIEGVSFRYNNIAFKGSQIDWKFSFGNLKKEFQMNVELLQEQTKNNQQQQETQDLRREQPVESKPIVHSISGVMLTPRQWQTLEEGGFIYLENINKRDSKEKFSSYVFLNEEKNKAFSCKKNPDTFVKYGKYEMRLRDKMLIEAGYITKAKVKWWGGLDFAYPYLWKENKEDAEYKKSWDNPKIQKREKDNIGQKYAPKQLLDNKKTRPKLR